MNFLSLPKNLAYTHCGELPNVTNLKIQNSPFLKLFYNFSIINREFLAQNWIVALNVSKIKGSLFSSKLEETHEKISDVLKKDTL